MIEPFDTLVIDEGQDLIQSEYLDVFDSLLKGGLAGGRWVIFCDFHHQAIYADTDADTMLLELEQRTSQFARFRLLINCRNTRPIGEEVSLISGFETPPFLPANVEGVPVDYRFFIDNVAQCALADEIVSRLLAEGIRKETITILSPVTLDNSCLATTEKISCKVKDITQPKTTEYPKGAIAFSTIHAFKGLENSIIIIADIMHLLDDRYRALLYVGMSRARHRLFVLVAQSARVEYQEAVRRSLRKGARTG